ncbi:acyl-CoA N-acyltransferase [Endogone sp. FLAS-F59071]|nr:acyl-CoA N-acyltransferase [Endogone sp. FLAS-F59071]|eukprot:RUS13940.1 acyl-CoA N-acyltransferase [Endogone sp. FLAS-F59071]
MTTLPSPPTTPPPILPRFAIRPAIGSDLPSILEIYNGQIIDTNAFFWLQPSTLKDRHAWLDHLRANEYPVIVAVETGAEMIVGCCALAPFAPGKSSKSRCAEVLLYIHKDHYEQTGPAPYLMREIQRLATRNQFDTIIASIGSDNTPYLALHHWLGYVPVGAVRHCVRKNGRWLYVEFHELRLGGWENHDDRDRDTSVNVEMVKIKPDLISVEKARESVWYWGGKE